MSELWSPAMRKWARDAHRHGIDIGFAKTRPSRKDWEAGGRHDRSRVVDISLDDRVTDAWTGSAATADSFRRWVD